MFILLDMEAKLTVVAALVWAVCHVIDADLQNPTVLDVRKTKYLPLQISITLLLKCLF